MSPRASRRGALSVASILLVACHGAPPQEQPPYAARAVVELDRQDVQIGGEHVGQLIHLEIQDPTGPVRFWRVEDRRGAWVGHVSDRGRFSKRVPFVDDEQDLGLWPMQQGIARLFDREGVAELRTAPAATAVPASAERQR